MNLAPTARPLRSALKEAAKRLFRRACEDVGVSLVYVADHLDMSPSRVENWLSPSVDANVPLYLLASRAAIPDRLFARIVADLESLRAQQGTGLVVAPESAATGVIERACAAIAELGRALADARVSSLDAPSVRREIGSLRDECVRMIRSLDHVRSA